MVLFGENGTTREIELKCNCIGDCRSITIFIPKDEEDDEVYVSVSAAGCTARHEWKLRSRLKECWKILFKSKVDLDDILLSKDELVKIADFIRERKE